VSDLRAGSQKRATVPEVQRGGEMTPADRAERKAHRDEITAAIKVIGACVKVVEYDFPRTSERIRYQLKVIATEADALR